MALSEQQLLMLDCFMYSDLTAVSHKGDTLGDIIEQFVDPVTKKISKERIQQSNVHFSGDMDIETFQNLLERMNKDETLKELTLRETTPEYKGSIRAACFVDKEGKATVAFRGTGGSYQQWYNNFEGFGDLSQETQDAATAFINSLPYDSIDVTGHSNGGDQAMYVAIVCAEKVNRCVSFEGQGVSKEFAEAHATEIECNKHKIKNICGERDFVSALLINIAGETVYVESEANLLGGLFHHGAYGILIANEKALNDNNGYFPESAYVEQAWYCKGIHNLTVFLSEHSDTPFVGPTLELFADFAGIIVGLVISKDWKDVDTLRKAAEDLVIAIKDFAVEEIKDCIGAIKEIAKRVGEWIDRNFNAGTKYANANPCFTVDTHQLKTYASRLEKVNQRITKLDKRMDSLYTRVGLLDLWNLMQADLLTGYSLRLRQAASYLDATASDLEAVEKELANAL